MDLISIKTNKLDKYAKQLIAGQLAVPEHSFKCE